MTDMRPGIRREPPRNPVPRVGRSGWPLEHWVELQSVMDSAQFGYGRRGQAMAVASFYGWTVTQASNHIASARKRGHLDNLGPIRGTDHNTPKMQRLAVELGCSTYDLARAMNRSGVRCR